MASSHSSSEIAKPVPVPGLPIKEGPLRILVRANQNRIRNGALGELIEDRSAISHAFFEQMGLQRLHRDDRYIHCLSTLHMPQSWVVIDYGVREVPEGSVASHVPILMCLANEVDGAMCVLIFAYLSILCDGDLPGVRLMSI